MMQFGIYPGGAAGADAGRLVAGNPDDPDRIVTALNRIDGQAPDGLLVRAYTWFRDETGSDGTDIIHPSHADQLLGARRRFDLVVQYRSSRGDVDGYARFVRNVVRRYGHLTAAVQVTEEPNVTGNALLDGAHPRVLEAIVQGAAAAREEARQAGWTDLRIGLNTTPLFGPSSSFLSDLAAVGGTALRDSLDYIGLDMFPDVFVPVADGDIRKATRDLLAWHRRDRLEPAGLGHLPLHITEHGWPTGPGRSAARQAVVLRDVIETVLELADDLRIAAYELFSLRDADSSGDSPFHHFGIMTDDYVPKPAFDVFRSLVEQRGVRSASAL